MDVYGIFIGDTNLSYGTMRNSVYRDYEKFPYGTFENANNPTLIDYYTKVQEKCRKSQKIELQKQTCPFCKEHKKRPLISYMRKRDFHKHHEKICEEDEEEQEQQGKESEKKVESSQETAKRPAEDDKKEKTKENP
uniref:Uncharacterized protein n=1 Tax=Tabanus bromius TaxID=304241 RepID=A0A0K8TQG3_TABBR